MLAWLQKLLKPYCADCAERVIIHEGRFWCPRCSSFVDTSWSRSPSLSPLLRASKNGNRDEVQRLLKECTDFSVIHQAIELADKGKWHAVSEDLRVALETLTRKRGVPNNPLVLAAIEEDVCVKVNPVSDGLRSIEQKLEKDLHFAEHTVTRAGANLFNWLPRLSPDEIKAAVAFARTVLAQNAGIDQNQMEYVKPVARKLLKEQYELLCEVGRGGFGVVYKARDVHLDQFVAIKELILENPAPLKDEARVLSDLRHKNIVGFRQLFPDGKQWYMVMDYVNGTNLGKSISSHALYQGAANQILQRALLIAREAAEGLHCAHQRGIIHQDVKPANIMIDAEGTAKVSDFGLAKAQPQSVGHRAAQSQESILVSRNGMTPAYCSPEQASGKKLTRRTDTWSWGLVVLEMFMGGATWTHGLAAPEVLKDYLARRAGTVKIASMPRELTVLLGRCFHVEPQSRPEMLEIVKMLATS